MYLLDVEYDSRKDASWAGARWDNDLRSWVYRGAALPAALKQFEARPYSWQEWRQAELTGEEPPRPPTVEVTLRDHQSEAVSAIRASWVSGAPGFLLADEVGLGKTYSTVAGIEELGENLNVLVLCPLSVVPHWRSSLQRYGTRNRWCVINYDRAKSLLAAPPSAAAAKKTKTKNKRHAQQGISLVEWDIVICDEAHRLRNPASQRSKAVQRLISTAPRTRKLCPSGAFVIWMSATAGQNPLELAYLSQLIAHRTGDRVRDLTDFEAWCKSHGIGVKRGPYGKWLWERNEADLLMMRRLLFDGDTPAGMRRRPQDIAGWPDLTRAPLPVELSPTERRLYDEAWSEFREELMLAKAANSGPEKNPLTAALRFRQKASMLRVTATAQLAADLVEDGLQVAVSVAFLESGSAISEALRGKGVRVVEINGSVAGESREEQRLIFQRGEADVVVFTVTEGISLHAGDEAANGTDTQRALILHDLRWSALETAQIEGRCHRDGQNAVAYHTYAADTVETDVATAMLTRLEDMAVMLGDDRTGLDALLEAANA